jgi:hypothetical protein
MFYKQYFNIKKIINHKKYYEYFIVKFSIIFKEKSNNNNKINESLKLNKKSRHFKLSKTFSNYSKVIPILKVMYFS